METIIPKITVIITTFNRAEYCREAILSVLNQTYKDFELIVLDNNSKDSTKETVEKFNDPRIRYICHPQMNIAQARNLGWQSARGQYIAYLDDDDRWLPNKLQAEFSLIDNSEKKIALVYGGFVKINKFGKRIGKHVPILKGKILKELIEQNDPFTGSASNPVLRKEVIAELNGYDENVVTGEDWELYLRLAKKYEISFTPSIVLEIRQHDGPRLGGKLKEAAQLELRVLEMYSDIFDANSSLKSFYLQKIGGKFIRSQEQKLGRSYLVKALYFNPFNFIVYCQYLLSFLGNNVYTYIHLSQQKYFKKLPFIFMN